MRVIIGGSSLAVLLALIIVIHTSVINKSVREDEINRGLENATDYAIDVCSSYYRYIQADDNDDTYITQLMEFFCMTLNSAVKTEGDITVSLAEADVDDGCFDFLVKQELYIFIWTKERSMCMSESSFIKKNNGE